jgi:hypothetical protein
MNDNKGNINNNLSKIIKNYFDELSYYNLYNFDIWISIIIIFIVLIIVIYFFSINTLENQKVNFEKNKCNPLFMPFASILNPEYANDPLFNKKNFEQCLNETNYNIAEKATSPLNGMFDSIMQFFTYLGGLVSQFISFLMYLLQLLYQIYELIIERLKIILSSINNLFIGVVNFFNHILGILTNLYYTLILLVDSLKYIFTVIALAFFSTALLPSIIVATISLVITLVSLVVAITVSVFAAFVPVLAATLWIIFATNLLIFLVALSISILFGLMYGILSIFASEIIANTPSVMDTETSMDETPVAPSPVDSPGS